MVRDQRSKCHLEDLKVSNPNVVIAPDAVFALADPEKLAHAGRDGRGSIRRIAISVREWAHFRTVDASVGNRRYREAILGLVAHVVKKYQCEVVFLSTCQGIAEYRDDSQVAAEIVAALPVEVARSVRVDDGFHDPSELLGVMTEFDLVIATRMHFAILALCAGVPVLPIEYEFKTRELFANLKHEELVIDIESISEEAIINMFDRMVGDLSNIRRALCQAVREQHYRAMASAQLLRDVSNRFNKAH
jgi:colanic acid/amylovoran biosynthesis protein